jgi:hypothetical protein
MSDFWRFAHRLALALGEPDPYLLMKTMPATTLDGWRAFDEVEPIGEPHADTRAAMLAMVIANGLLRGKHQRAYELDDFMLEFGERKTRQLSPDAFAEKLIALTKAMGGTIIDKRKAA